MFRPHLERAGSGTLSTSGVPCSCCGLLRVQKSWQSSKGAKALPQADVHVIRHKRRRLAIEVLQACPFVPASTDMPSVPAAMWHAALGCVQCPRDHDLPIKSMHEASGGPSVSLSYRMHAAALSSATCLHGKADCV